MNRRRLLLGSALLASGVLVLLSPAEVWIVRDRELSGEGFRRVMSQLGAWEVPAAPVLSVAIVGAAACGLLALAALTGRRLPPWLTPALVALTVGALAAQLVTVSQDGFSWRIDLRPAWGAWLAGLLGLALAAGLLLAESRPRLAPVLATVVGTALVAGLGVAGRQAVLVASEPTGEHWADGTYVRAATDGRPELTLVISDGRYRIGDRYSGTWLGQGLTVSLDDDPACPDARGTYHAHDEGPEGGDLRFVAVVDPCLDGERRAELETGIWVRQP
ncbi:MAG TPA: hypothetical protein VFH63_06025 [candidate division Zixibacteria bacterium]|nr:hypothetical protein [candidate division Zixibacteria bacterium]